MPKYHSYLLQHCFYIMMNVNLNVKRNNDMLSCYLFSELIAEKSILIILAKTSNLFYFIKESEKTHF